MLVCVDCPYISKGNGWHRISRKRHRKILRKVSIHYRLVTCPKCSLEHIQNEEIRVCMRCSSYKDGYGWHKIPKGKVKFFHEYHPYPKLDICDPCIKKVSYSFTQRNTV